MNNYSNKYMDYPSSSSSQNSISQADYDAIAANHKFLWNEKDQAQDWKQQLAKKYHDKLYKEFCISDLSYYKCNKIALRWRTKQEVIDGKGENKCADKHCEIVEDLKTWEVNFRYSEQGETKNALVKLRLCKECSIKLNYYYAMRKQRAPKEVSVEVHPRKAKKECFSLSSSSDSDDDLSKKNKNITKARHKNKNEIELEEKKKDDISNDNIWSNKPTSNDDKDEDIKVEDYLEDLL